MLHSRRRMRVRRPNASAPCGIASAPCGIATCVAGGSSAELGREKSRTKMRLVQLKGFSARFRPRRFSGATFRSVPRMQCAAICRESIVRTTPLRASRRYGNHRSPLWTSEGAGRASVRRSRIMASLGEHMVQKPSRIDRHKSPALTGPKCDIHC